LISTPWRAAEVKAAMMATGVEITRAQGQAATSNINARYDHIENCGIDKCESENWELKIGGIVATAIASRNTAGVYVRANLSTNCCVGALRACASSIRFKTRATALSPATADASISNAL